jgi:predicted HAD superfamily Cof-like phosphohydrolase
MNQPEIVIDLLKANEAVKEFHREFELLINESPTLVDRAIVLNRIRLIQEELSEYAAGAAKGDLVEIADALTDLLYVVVGGFVEHGLPMDKLFVEVHRSNMTKIGGVKDQAGKLVKPASYEPPRLESIIYG